MKYLVNRKRSSCFRNLRYFVLFSVFSLLIVNLCGFELVQLQKGYTKDAYRTKNRFAVSRHLLSSVEWEKCDFEIGHKRNYSDPNSWHSNGDAKLWVALYIVLVLIVFVALAIICDDFFVPSLEAISEKLNLSEDVAGATFMAAGSSAPELFTSIAGVTVESDVGVGTIVGSAVFNLLGICALSAAFAGQVLNLDWRPLTRDATYYGTSIGLFILFAWDGKFELYESTVMLGFYFLYIVVMKFNPKLMEMMAKCGIRKRVKPAAESNCDNTKKNTQLSNQYATGCEEVESEVEKPRKFSHINKGILSKELTGSHTNMRLDPVGENNGVNSSVPTETDEQGKSTDITPVVVCPCLPPVEADIPTKHGPGCLNALRLILSWILFIVSFPFVVLFTWTIPSCSTPETKKYYMFSFIMSIAWIAALSFAMVTLVGRTGCILSVDKFTMGLVVVAIGTSIPDALSSILVARDGYGDMAVSNAIGSNVFDIDLGLGLPFVISSLIRNFEPVKLLSPQDQIKYDSGEMVVIPHVKFGFLLLVILFASLVVFGICKFRLTKHVGVTFVLFYFAFVGYAYIQDIHCNGDC